LKKSPLKDLRRVAEHPERLSNRLLEQTECQEGIIFLHLREKEEGIIFLRGLSLREAQKRQCFGCKDSTGVQKSESFKDLGPKLRRSSVSYMQARIQSCEARREKKQRSRPLKN
jgi:hypothetical protein